MQIRLLWIIFIFLFFCPVNAYPAFIICLKNGGTFVTNHYWAAGNEIQFLVRNGAIGIQKDSIKSIRKIDDINIIDTVADKDTTDKKNKDIPAIEDIRKDAKIDRQQAATVDKTLQEPVLASLKEKKMALTRQLNEALERVRQATGNRKPEEKEKAMLEVREISKEIYDLTDDVRKRNNGVLPEDWWSE
jgi:hypothetical protein